MTAWALYLLAVSALLGVAARAGESALALYGRPVRWMWALALAGGLILPLVVRPGPERVSGTAVSPELLEHLAVATPEAAAEPSLLDRIRAPEALDRAFGWFWAGSAGLALLGLAVWFGAVALAPRRWPRRRMDEEDVRVAPAAGPAVFGLVRPSIVVPRWLLDCPSEVRRLALLHEREHVRARDPALLAFSATLVALTPWNPVAWWLFARLRAAVELDCDRRVLRRGADAHAYGAMLLGIAGRTASPRAALALVEPAVLLERRIREMTRGRSKGRIARGLALASLCAIAVAAACSMDGPTEPAPVQTEAETAAETEMTEAGMRVRIMELTDEASMLLDRLGDPSLLLGKWALLRRTAAEGNDAAAAETRTVIGQLVEAQERARLESKVPEEVEITLDREQVLRSAAEALMKAQGEIGEIEEVRIADPDTLILLREVPQERVARIRLRGQPHSDRQEPLIFIDGELASPWRMQELSPDRIESIEVIKGAAAARLYGETAASGVIHIITK